MLAASVISIVFVLCVGKHRAGGCSMKLCLSLLILVACTELAQQQSKSILIAVVNYNSCWWEIEATVIFSYFF